MATKFLDSTGALYIISKVKELLSKKVDSVDGKGLSSNDFTTEEKNKLSGLSNYTHPTTAGNKHIPSGGSSGQILRWSASGTAVWGDDKDTTYSAATQSTNGLMSSTDKKKLDAFGEASTYALKTDITNAYIYKGSVDTEADLPTSGLKAGYVYNIVAASSYGAAGMNVAWTGSAWDALGEMFSIDAITTTEIDAMFA